MISLNEYQKLSARTINPEQSLTGNLENFALGLVGEAGETADHVKKVQFHGRTLDTDAFAKELGDVMWYVAAMATAIKRKLSEIQFKRDNTGDREPVGYIALRLGHFAGKVSGYVIDVLEDGEHTIDAPRISLALANIIWEVQGLCVWAGFDFADVCQQNIDKLLARYPEGFKKAKSAPAGAEDVGYVGP